MLYGRSEEIAELDHLLAAARSGRSGVLVIRGEAGIGKSALLRYAGDRAGDMRVLRGSGLESESELPYAGLHLLLGRTIADGTLDRLPDVQAQALRAALGLESPGPDTGSRFLVGLAVLTVLDELAADRPVLCLVDDAQWLDAASAEALLFAARRLEAEGVAIAFAVREPHAPILPTPGLPELRPPGLAAAEADAMLAATTELAPEARHRIAEAAQGNPLALLALSERPDAPDRGEVVGGRIGASDGRIGAVNAGIGPSGARVRQVFTDRIAALPEATRTLLLVAAADDTGVAATVLRAAGRLGSAPEALDPAEEARLLRIEGDDVVFGHPLIRTTAYRQATARRRREAHRALAEVLDPQADADRQAWHRAAAATGPDEEIASGLESTAGRARARGGLAAVATGMEHAAALTPDPAERTRRYVDAARAAADAGRYEQASAHLDAAGLQPEGQAGGGRQWARAAKIRAVLPAAYRQGRSPHEFLVEVALGTPEEAADRDVWYDVVRAAWIANDFVTIERVAACGNVLPEAATLARAALATNRLDAGEFGPGVAAVRHLLEEEPPQDARRAIVRARLHLITADVDSTLMLSTRLEGDARETGAIGLLPEILVLRARSELFVGRVRDALATAADGRRIALDTGQAVPALELATILAELAAMAGDEERTRSLTAEALERGIAPASVHAATALSLLDLGLGRYDDALARLEAIVGGPRPMGALAALPVLVEAAVRAGRPDRATGPAQLYAEWATAIGRPEIDAIALRCRALAADDPDLLDKAARMPAYPFDRARSELLSGERLRRDRHMVEARTRLRSALETFERLGAQPWVERARGELRATGESRAADRDLAPALVDRLTPQELQVVRLAAGGASNREIGGQLFLSPRTVGHHLYKAFPKLGVASRAELAGLGLQSID